MSVAPKPAVPDLARSVRLEWWGAGVLLVLLAVVLAGALYREHAALEEQESDRLQVQARVIDETLARQLEGVSNALANIGRELGPDGGKPSWGSLSARLEAFTAAMPGVRTIAIVDAGGTIVASSRAGLVGVDTRQRVFPGWPQDYSNPATLYVSPPFQSSFGGFALAVGRSLSGPGGTFAGVVTATLDPEYFNVVLSSVLYAPDMRTTLIHGDGRIFLNVPTQAQALGMDLATPGSLFTRHQASGQAATLATGKAFAGQDDRLVALRAISRPALKMDKPLVVAVSREVSAIFAPWRAKALRFATFYAVVVLGAGVGLHFSQSRRRALESVARAALKEQQVDSELRAAYARLRSSEDRLTLALEGSGLALFDWDLQHDRVYHSARASAMRDEAPTEVTAPPAELLGFVHPDDIATMRSCAIEALIGRAEVYDCEFRLRRRSGEWLWVRAHGRVVERDAAGRGLRLIGTYADINERKLAEAQLRRRAEFDLLTNLPNRALFLDRLQLAMQRASADHRMALMFLDVDHFKRINDTLGHAAGDRLLMVFAQRMRDCVRHSDAVARLAGDEFTILLEGLRDAAAARTLADTLVETLRAPIDLDGQIVHTTVSIGVAMWTEGEHNGEALLRRADLALYEAKRRGRNGFFCEGDDLVHESSR